MFWTAHWCKNVKSAWVKVAKWQNFAQSGHTAHMEEPKGKIEESEVVFLVVCDPSMNELWAT